MVFVLDQIRVQFCIWFNWFQKPVCVLKSCSNNLVSGRFSDPYFQHLTKMAMVSLTLNKSTKRFIHLERFGQWRISGRLYQKIVKRSTFQVKYYCSKVDDSKVNNSKRLSNWSRLWSVEFLDFLAVMAQDLASDFNSEKDTDSIRGIFDFYDAFDRGYITHQQLRYDQVNSLMSHRSCDVWTYVFIQEIRERNRSMSLIIRDLKTGSNRPVSLGTVIVSGLNYSNQTVRADHDLRKPLNLRPLELPWKWAKDWMKLKSPNS